MTDRSTSTRPQKPRSVFSAIGLTLVSQGAVVVLGLLSGILIARLLGAGGKGDFNTLYITAGVLGLLAELGLRLPTIRMVASGRLDWKEAVATLTVIYGAICAALLPVATLLLYYMHDRIAHGIPLPILYLALALTPLILLEFGYVSILNGMQRTPEGNTVIALEKFVFVCGLMLLVWGGRYGLYGAIISTVSGSFIALIAALLILRRLPSHGRFRIRFDVLRELLRFGRSCYATNLATSLNYRLDALLIFAMLGNVPAGIYSVAVSMAEFAQHLPNSIAQVHFPSVSGDDTNAEKRTTYLSRVTVFVLLVACAGVIAIGYPAIALLYGREFLSAYGVSLFLLPGMVVLGQSKLISIEMTARGFPHFAARASWITLGSTVLLDLLLIPCLGIAGAAIASTVAYTISAVVLFFYYRRLTGASLRELYSFKREELAPIVRRLLHLPGQRTKKVE